MKINSPVGNGYDVCELYKINKIGTANNKLFFGTCIIKVSGGFYEYPYVLRFDSSIPPVDVHFALKNSKKVWLWNGSKEFNEYIDLFKWCRWPCDRDLIFAVCDV